MELIVRKDELNDKLEKQQIMVLEHLKKLYPKTFEESYMEICEIHKQSLDLNNWINQFNLIHLIQRNLNKKLINGDFLEK